MQGKNCSSFLKDDIPKSDLKEVLQNLKRIFNTCEGVLLLSPKTETVLAKRDIIFINSSYGDETDNLMVLITANTA